MVAIAVLLSCSRVGGNPGKASGSEKRIQELIKQLDGRARVRATRELTRIGERSGCYGSMEGDFCNRRSVSNLARIVEKPIGPNQRSQ